MTDAPSVTTPTHDTPPADPADSRRRLALAVLLPLFLTSGATSLVYETVWERELHLVAGTSQLAVITVLAAFMAGLAAGGFLSGRVADRVARPLLVYGILEGAIGLYALLYPVLVSAVEPIYGAFWAAFHPSPLVFAVFQFLLFGLMLLPPTIAMGGTLPLLARFAAGDSEQAGVRIGLLYGANTIGAVIGVGLAGFFLLPKLGLQTTTFITAGANLLLCAVAVPIGLRAPALPPSVETAAQQAEPPQPWVRTLFGLAFLAGLSALLYEVAWFRLLVLQLGGSAFAFSVMLLAFLMGIGFGGLAGGPLADRIWARGEAYGALRLVVGLQCGVALLAWLAMHFYGELPFIFVDLYSAVEDNKQWLWPAKLGLALSIMFPPAFLMGASFPVLVRAAVRSTSLGGPVGRLYGWNTVGAILGASIGGLVVLPQLSVRTAVLIGVSINLIAAVFALRGAELARKEGPRLGPQLTGFGLASMVIGLVHLFPPAWEPLLMTAGMYKYASEMDPEERTREGILEFSVTPYDLLFYKEGLSSVVTVAQSKESKNIWLANNGKVDASTTIDMPTLVLCAHLPFIFQKEAQDVMVIGLASGITAGSITLHSAPKRIDVIELEPAIVDASHFFDEYNNRPLEDPRVTLYANDARNHIVLTPPQTYDIIISEPSNPWLTGVSNLFTKDFLEVGKTRLKPGGVWSQWVQLYGMDNGDVQSLLRTVAEVYPHVLVFTTIEGADLVLLGSEQPLHLTAEKVEAMLRRPGDEAVALEMQAVNSAAAEDVLARYRINRDQILLFTSIDQLNTDDNMRIEYSAPLHLHDDMAEGDFVKLLPSHKVADTILYGHFEESPEGFLRMAEAYSRNEDFVRASVVLIEGERRWPDRPDLTLAKEKAQADLAESLAEEEE